MMENGEILTPFTNLEIIVLVGSNKHNKSLHWIFNPLRSVKASDFNRYAAGMNAMNNLQWKK